MSDNLIIDNAKLSDIEAIVEIENLCFTLDGFSKRQFNYLLKNSKGRFLTAKINTKLVAYMILLKPKHSKKIRLYSIAVHPDERGKNIAQSLITKSKEIAKELHCSSISLEVRTDNLSAQNLYLKNGFTNIGIKSNFYSDGANANVMSWLVI